jgi:hypothetical protein
MLNYETEKKLNIKRDKNQLVLILETVTMIVGLRLNMLKANLTKKQRKIPNKNTEALNF